MVSQTVGTTVAELFPENPRRVHFVVVNLGSADELVRISKDKDGVSDSAYAMYNRESVKIKGEHARRRWWVISDTASTAIAKTETVRG